MKYFLILIASAALASGAANPLELPMAKITVKAVDEQGIPVSGASVRISFEPAIPTWGGSAPVNVRGTSDANGQFSASGHAEGFLGGVVEKSGYYTAWSKAAQFTNAVDGEWQPWNPTLTAVLKKIGDPIPMYARRVTTQIPVLDRPIGFDLMQGDWLPPYGHGVTGDFIFEAKTTPASGQNDNGQLSLTFSGTGDGIQAIPVSDRGLSMLRLPRTAPDSGYTAQLDKSSSASQSQATKAAGFIYRVRSSKGKNGSVVALYGKIDGDIEWGHSIRGTTWMKFTYYLNPTVGDQNLEFDTKRNLFDHLGILEAVKYP